MIWIVIFRDLNSILLAQELTIFRLYLPHQAMLFLSGPKTKQTQRVRATMVSIHFNIFEFIKVKIGNSFLCSITKFKMLNGLRMVNSSSLFQDSNQQWLLCTILMVNQPLNSGSNSKTQLRYVHLALCLWLVVLVTLQKVRWTSGT